MIIPENKIVRQLVWHLYVDTAVEDSELFCYNTEGIRNSVVIQVSYTMGWTLLELQAETRLGKLTIYKILMEGLHL